jgi:hypothetical protein
MEMSGTCKASAHTVHEPSMHVYPSKLHGAQSRTRVINIKNMEMHMQRAINCLHMISHIQHQTFLPIRGSCTECCLDKCISILCQPCIIYMEIDTQEMPLKKQSITMRNIWTQEMETKPNTKENFNFSIKGALLNSKVCIMAIKFTRVHIQPLHS